MILRTVYNQLKKYDCEFAYGFSLGIIIVLIILCLAARDVANAGLAIVGCSFLLGAYFITTYANHYRRKEPLFIPLLVLLVTTCILPFLLGVTWVLDNIEFAAQPLGFWIFLGFLVFLFMEFFYYFSVVLDPPKKPTLWWVLGHKLEQLADILLFGCTVLVISWIGTTDFIEWKMIYRVLMTLGTYIFLALLGLGAIIGWLWLNKQLIPKRKVSR